MSNQRFIGYSIILVVVIFGIISPILPPKNNDLNEGSIHRSPKINARTSKTIQGLPSNPSYCEEIFPDLPLLHTSEVTSVSFSRNGTLLASGSLDTTIKLWNITNGVMIKDIDNINDVDEEVLSVALSPENSELAFATTRNRVKIFDISDGNSKTNLTGLFLVQSVAYSPSSLNFVTGGNNHLKLWNISEYEEWNCEILSVHDSIEPITSVTISENGEYIATSHSEYPYVRLWSMETGQFIRSFPDHQAAVLSVDFSFDGTILASSGMDLMIKIWNVTSGELIHSYDNAHDDQVNSIAFSPKSNILASGSSDFTIKLWNLSQGNEIYTIDALSDEINTIVFSPTGDILASGGSDGSIKLWNMNQGIEISKLPGEHSNIKTATFSPDGSLIGAGGFDGSLKIWNVTDSYSLILDVNLSEQLNTIKFSPNNQFIACGGINTNITLISIINSTNRHFLVGHNESINSIDFSSTGHILASGSSDKTIRLWNVTSLKSLHNITAHIQSVYCVKFNPTDDSVLVSGSSNDGLKFWNTTDGLEIGTKIAYPARINSIKFLKDGVLFITGSSDGNITLWNIKTRNRVLSFVGESGTIIDVDLSSDEEQLVTCSINNEFKIWEVTTGNLKHIFRDTGYVSTISFSKFDEMILSGGLMGVKTWSINPIPNDIDADGMDDLWEENFQLNASDFYDRFHDLDQDGLTNSLEFHLDTDPMNPDQDGDLIPDGWEYLMKSNFFINDSFLDVDNDAIPNYYEYLHGLNALRHDSMNDKDKDGIPNYWEYVYGLKASYPLDASQDLDKDWISNLDEYLGDSNPRDFWSVPLLSFSFVHMIVFLISSVFIIILGLILLFITRKRLMLRLKAPNYIIAQKIIKGNFSDYNQYKITESEAYSKAETASKKFYEGFPKEALRLYQETLDIYYRLNNEELIAEIIFKLAYTQSIIGDKNLSKNHINIIQSLNHKFLIVKSYHYMVSALLAESKKDWIEAGRKWSSARAEIVFHNQEREEKQLQICKTALAELEIKSWLNNPSDNISDSLEYKINQWEEKYRNNQNYKSLCSLLLLRARMALALYSFKEVTDWLDKCETASIEGNLKIYGNLVKNEKEKIRLHKQRISALMEADKFLTHEERTKLVQDYLNKASDYTKHFSKEMK